MPSAALSLIPPDAGVALPHHGLAPKPASGCDLLHIWQDRTFGRTDAALRTCAADAAWPICAGVEGIRSIFSRSIRRKSSHSSPLSPEPPLPPARSPEKRPFCPKKNEAETRLSRRK